MAKPRRAGKTVVRFGEAEISENVVSGNVTTLKDGALTAEVVVRDEALLVAHLDYQSEVQVLMGTPEDLHPTFTGMVDVVTPLGGRTRISMVTISQRFKEQRLGGLGLSRVGAREIMWAMARSVGYENDKIDIEGYEPGPLEVFEVATALDGIDVREPTAVGDVRLLPGGPVVRMADGLGPEMLKQRFTDGSAWAFTLRTAHTLLEAESEGLKAIDAALAWVATRTRYSGAALPGGPTRSFRRDWTAARVSRRDVVAVRGVSTDRRWLRSPRGIAYAPDLVLAEVKDLDVPPLPPDLSPQMREALSSWRRAAEAEDPLAAVVALWESIEFYVSGVRTEELFSRPERRAVLKRAIEGLEGEQLARVRTVVGGLNNAPLMPRLLEALKQDGVPHTEEELALLGEVRRLRNDFVHGRSRELPSEVDLRYARSIVNRMLVYRITRLCEPSSTISASAAAALLRDGSKEPS